MVDSIHDELHSLGLTPVSTSGLARPNVLVVEDDPVLRELLLHELNAESFPVSGVGSGREALEVAKGSRPGIVLLDLGLPDIPGQDVLQLLHRENPDLPVIILTAASDAETVVSLMKAGAVDFVPKPFDRTRVVAAIHNATRQARLSNEVKSLRKQLGQGAGFQNLVGESPSLVSSIELLRRAAGSDVSVLIEGESGSGKEVAARSLHEESHRRNGPFVAINCGALPEGLVESELFGHEKGAFTGATSRRAGCFEEAEGGTLFLDEIGELSLDVQVRLLRVVQERTLQRLGSNKPVQVDVRIVAATHRDLRKEVDEGRFREDLYYRLAVFPVRLPALRDRGTDVLLLARHFLGRLGAQLGKADHSLSPQAEQVLLAHSWPGNTRELMNVVQRTLIMCDAREIGSDDLILGSQEKPSASAPVTPQAPLPRTAVVPQADSEGVLTWQEYEERILRHALKFHAWNIQATTRALGIGRATLYRKIDRFGLRRPEDSSAEEETKTGSG